MQPVSRPLRCHARFARRHILFIGEHGSIFRRLVRLVPALIEVDEILHNLSEQDARFEAARCLSCGNCFECDGCYGACPENAIIKLGPGKRYKFDFDKCTGCAVCYEQCPCHAIDMLDEPEVMS